MERYAVQSHEHEEYQQCQSEVYERGDILRQQEHILREVNLGDDARILHEGVHASVGGVLEEGVGEVAREEVYGAPS